MKPDEAQLAKLRGHAEHLLDLFRRLCATFAFLEPMLFDGGVIAAHSAGRKGHAFKVIRDRLVYACVQDIANLMRDRDDRSPSIEKLIVALEDTVIRDHLRDAFSSWSMPPDPSWTPEMAQEVRARDQARKRARFDQRYADAVASWEALRDSPAYAGFKAFRDKLTAHTELIYVDGEYRPFDAGTLKLKMADLKATIEAMEELVKWLNLLIRNSSFLFDDMRKKLARDTAAYWNTPPPKG